VFGPGTTSSELRYTGSRGELHHQAAVIQVSNNPYDRRVIATKGSRASVATGQLGLVTLQLDGDHQIPAFFAALATGHAARFDGFDSWTAESFVVDGDGPIDTGIDGEHVPLDPPLVFAIQPGAVRLRLPNHAIGYSPSARAVVVPSVARSLWAVALGKGAPIAA
jgi:diacylglycerol kinase family enzyme